MSGRSFPGTVPTLEGAGISLREMNEDDIPGWYARATDAESARLAGDPIPHSMDEGHALLRRNRQRFAERRSLRWAIVPAQSTHSVGSIGLAFAPAEKDAAEMGLVVARAWWSRGVGTAAVRRVAGYAFDTLGLSRLRAEMLQSNVASRRLFEKAGFQLLEVIPDFEPSEAAREDGYRYVLTRSA